MCSRIRRRRWNTLDPTDLILPFWWGSRQALPIRQAGRGNRGHHHLHPEGGEAQARVRALKRRPLPRRDRGPGARRGNPKALCPVHARHVHLLAGEGAEGARKASKVPGERGKAATGRRGGQGTGESHVQQLHAQAGQGRLGARLGPRTRIPEGDGDPGRGQTRKRGDLGRLRAGEHRKAGLRPRLREEVGKKLEEKYIHEALDPEGKTSEQLRTSILEIFCPKPESTRGFINRLKAHAKGREKTKLLLEEVVKRGYLTRQTDES